MALLTLQDIGKIYVSEGAVAVGIRGVNLSFDKGEFVAVTGKSGSGKSTLLNVISGMDSYEEGELYIEGQSTSHYLQKEWEDYREKYISFIFQDYNIIESFTVLENVELALMHIEDKKERRRRALELLSRVGLSSHIKQKGSRLSGGQKQRTVIARALAKDSPIILADEPTGNLDSATSKEIIQLLREVSKDKLLIMVTHNFEQVEDFATRHIRVFDGAIESDHTLSPKANVESREAEATAPQKKKSSDLARGITLGKAIFRSKPRLSSFLSLLLIVGMLGIFLVTSFCGEAASLFEDDLMFTHVDGRVVLTHQDGAPLGEEELTALAKELSAKEVMRFDYLLDLQLYHSFYDNEGDYHYLNMQTAYDSTLGQNAIGRYPEKKNEIALSLPISYQPAFGENELLITSISLFNGLTYKVVGVSYYYDNNIDPTCHFTAEGFRIASTLAFLERKGNLNLAAAHFGFSEIAPSFDLPDGKIFITDDGMRKEIDKVFAEEGEKHLTLSTGYQSYDPFYGDTSYKNYQIELSPSTLTDTPPEGYKPQGGGSISEGGKYDYYDPGYRYYNAYVSVDLVTRLIEEMASENYKQASLFFENDKEAHRAAELLQAKGYVAVPSDSTHEMDSEEAILNMLSALLYAVMWFVTVFFLAFFIALCSRRTLEAFKGDMAIMRSMGISVKVIRTGMYVRMILSLIPSVILLVLAAYFVFTTPALNEIFIYLYFWQYALIVVGMFLLTLLITRRHIKRLFGESVKKSLKGDSAV